MKKGLCCILIGMLMFSGSLFPLTTASTQQKILSPGSESQMESMDGNSHHGFVIGYYTTIAWDDDRCILTTDGGSYPHNLPVTFIIPFRLQWCAPNKQIQLDNPRFCLFLDNFVIGYCTIVFPESTLLMHVISQNDDFNTIRWVVDEIQGDMVWGGNLDAELFYQNGSRYARGLSMGPYPWKATYLSVGDEIKVTADVDGTYQLKLIDTISGHVVFTSPFLDF